MTAATVKKFAEYIDLADEAGKRAMGWIDSSQGTARGPLFAGLAAMWMERARLEHQMLFGEKQEREIRRLGERIAVLEAKLGVLDEGPPMPDPFAEADTPVSGF